VRLLASRLGLDAVKLYQLERECAAEGASDDSSDHIHDNAYASGQSKRSDASSDGGHASMSSRSVSDHATPSTPSVESHRVSSAPCLGGLSPALTHHEPSDGAASEDERTQTPEMPPQPPDDLQSPYLAPTTVFLHPAQSLVPAPLPSAGDGAPPQPQQCHGLYVPMHSHHHHSHHHHPPHPMDMPGSETIFQVPRDPWMAALQIDASWGASWPTPT
jgi:hypothetical protein